MIEPLSHIVDIPRYVFGPLSHLATDEGAERSADVVLRSQGSVSVWYIVALLVVLALYLEWLNQWSIRGTNHLRTFKFLGPHRGGYSAKRSEITPSYSEYSRLASLIGYAVIWLASLRAMGLIGFDSSAQTNYNNLTLVVAAIAPVIYIYQIIVIYIISIITRNREFREHILQLKAIIFTIFVMVATPAILCFAAGGNLWRELIVYIAGAVGVVTLLLYIYEYFLLFLSKKVSIFHTFLYLCTVEIFPITLIWGYFNR